MTNPHPLTGRDYDALWMNMASIMPLLKRRFTCRASYDLAIKHMGKGRCLSSMNYAQAGGGERLPHCLIQTTDRAMHCHSGDS